MSARRNRKSSFWLAAAVAGFALLHTVSSGRAQHLPARFYNVADGLPASWIGSVYQDAKGYIWVTTGLGLSRFDGYGFKSYGSRQNLGGRAFFSSVVEDRTGAIWVGTIGPADTPGSGVARLLETEQDFQGRSPGDSNFVVYPISDDPKSNTVSQLVVDQDNGLWCLTSAGLFRGKLAAREPPHFQLILPGTIHSVTADRQGNIWVALDRELVRIERSGAQHRWPTPVTFGTLVTDAGGQVFAATDRKLFKFTAPTVKDVWQAIPISLDPEEQINTLTVGKRDDLLVGTTHRLLRRKKDETSVGSKPLLTEYSISVLVEDREGHVWVGTEGGGVGKLSVDKLSSFTQTEGLPWKQAGDIYRDHVGNIYVSNSPGGIVRIDPTESLSRVAGSELHRFGMNSTVLIDSRNNWWLGTTAGLLRVPGSELKIGRQAEFVAGVPRTAARLVFEDSTGAVWASLGHHDLFRFSENALPVSKSADLNAAGFTTGVLRMADAGGGDLWLCSHTQLARWMNQRITLLEPTTGLPEITVRSLFRDSRGWMWIGLRNSGVSVTKNPGAETPQFTNYSSANGLSDDTVWTITEDRFGRMYLGTERGLNQLDPTTGQVLQITSKDGLAGDLVYRSIADLQGNVWVATNGGASKYTPGSREAATDPPPPTYLNKIDLAGRELQLPRGAVRLPHMTLEPAHNSLRIEWVGISFLGELSLVYQYKLDGVDADWSRPTPDHSVNYANLEPGSYRFMVRAIGRSGAPSLEPAVFEFRILRPIWQRPWFIALVLIACGVAIYLIYRYRLRHLIELEQVKTRIATDLHDDIGSGLSQIAILSEVASGRIAADKASARETLGSIAATSRTLVDSMSDIVWAIDPDKDHLSNLSQRMRMFASETLANRDIDFSFREPGESLEMKLSADLRRQVFLVFKEGVTNIATHAGCTRAEIDLAIDDGHLSLRLADNGSGFDPAGNYEGHGLSSMRRRARDLGGTLEIATGNGHGTTLALRVPLRPRSRPRRIAT